jgi:hypothetical protein
MCDSLRCSRYTSLQKEDYIFYLGKLVMTDENVDCSKPDAIRRIN